MPVILAITRSVKYEDPTWAKMRDPISKITRAKTAGGMAQMEVQGPEFKRQQQKNSINYFLTGLYYFLKIMKVVKSIIFQSDNNSKSL
jgi:hypothetical protein